MIINSIKKFLNLPAWKKIIFSLIFGILTGIALGQKAVYLKPIGEVFINGIHMIILPVIFTSIVCAVMSVDDPKRLGSIGLKALGLYAVSMIIASSLGIVVANYISPGSGLGDMKFQNHVVNMASAPSLLSMFVDMLPSNPAASFVSGNILQVLIFSIFMGLSINLAGEKAEPVAKFFKSMEAVAMKLAQIIIWFAPLGIFALMAWVTGKYGWHALLPLMKLVFTVYFACFSLVVLYYSVVLFIVARVNPLTFFKNIREAILFAFSTSSSAATLPITMRCAVQNLGIEKSLSDSLLPLGTTMNLNGLSIYLSVATIFAANIFGVHLSFTQYITVVITIILTCMGAGGIPGSGIVVMGAVMSSVGLPLGAVTLIAGVDRLNDMAQTTTNVIGDLFTAFLISKKEKGLLHTEDTIPEIVLQRSEINLGVE